MAASKKHNSQLTHSLTLSSACRFSSHAPSPLLALTHTHTHTQGVESPVRPPFLPVSCCFRVLRCKRGVAATGMRGRGWLVGVLVGAGVLLSLCVVWLDFFSFTARFGKEVQPAQQPARKASHMYGVPGYCRYVLHIHSLPASVCTTEHYGTAVNGLPMPAFLPLPLARLPFPSAPPRYCELW